MVMCCCLIIQILHSSFCDAVLIGFSYTSLTPRSRKKKALRIFSLSACFYWWPRAESNHRHKDFQSSALPTELLGHLKRGNKRNIRLFLVVTRLDEVARPAGFEPTTPWFVAKYSIQLSYGRFVQSNYFQLLSNREIISD